MQINPRTRRSKLCTYARMRQSLFQGFAACAGGAVRWCTAAAADTGTQPARMPPQGTSLQRCNGAMRPTLQPSVHYRIRRVRRDPRRIASSPRSSSSGNNAANVACAERFRPITDLRYKPRGPQLVHLLHRISETTPATIHARHGPFTRYLDIFDIEYPFREHRERAFYSNVRLFTSRADQLLE